MQGKRNPIDRLWDIPVGKHTITDENYRIPSIHPGIYATRQKNTNVKKVNTDNKLQVSSHNIFRKELAKYGDIIDHNILDTFLEHSAKHNKTEYLKADLAPQTPSMAVIIKKKQTHTDLASYLHAACFSPVRSTFASAIAKNSSKHGQG